MRISDWSSDVCSSDLIPRSASRQASMFSKTKDSSSTPESHTSTSSEPKRSTAKAGVPSIISADLRITGNLKSDGDIQVDGHVEGDIDSATLTVGEGAHVKGHISCESEIGRTSCRERVWQDV